MNQSSWHKYAMELEQRCAKLEAENEMLARRLEARKRLRKQKPLRTCGCKARGSHRLNCLVWQARSALPRQLSTRG